MAVTKVEDHLIRNFDAEKAIFGAILLNSDVLDKLKGILDDDCFPTERSRSFYRGATALHDQGSPVDLITLPQWLKEHDLDRDGKAGQILARIADEISTSAGAEYHARIVRDDAVRRRAVNLLENTGKRLTREDPKAVLSDLEAGLHDLNRAEEAEGSTHPKPLEVEQTAVGRFLDREPEPIEYVFEEVLPAGIAAEIMAAGGTGKSFLMIGLGMSASAGEPILHKHLKPSRPHLVLYLAAEDPEPILHSRVYHTFEKLVPKGRSDLREQILRNFHVASAVGRVGPLMQLDGGNPVKSQWWFWLYKTIEAMGGVDLLMLDPKSRLFGLEENTNDHNTAWIACLEEINRVFGCTTLFSHHVSKKSGGALEQASSRGGSALTDGCRWVSNARALEEERAKRFGVNSKEFIEFDVSKNNYSPHLPARLYFQRAEHGVLVQANPEFDRIRDKARGLCEVLAEFGQDGTRFSRRDLREKPGKEIREDLKVTTRETMDAIDHALREGWLKSVPGTGFGRGRREVLEATIEG